MRVPRPKYALKQSAEEAYREYETTGSTTPLLLDKLTQEEFDELSEQLAAEKSQEYKNIVTAKTGVLPHVLVKMGSYHAGRGLSPVNRFDIGNFLSECALSQGQQSYHIIVIAPQQLSARDSRALIPR